MFFRTMKFDYLCDGLGSYHSSPAAPVAPQDEDKHCSFVEILQTIGHIFEISRRVKTLLITFSSTDNLLSCRCLTAHRIFGDNMGRQLLPVTPRQQGDSEIQHMSRFVAKFGSPNVGWIEFRSECGLTSVTSPDI